VTSPEPTVPPVPAVSHRDTVSRAGAPIRLERLTISLAVREAIERQFQKILASDNTAPQR
jgi:hypothetical protein